ncbi:hypothetical protein DRN58_08795 [Thermococci archaeon]|nr:MAG: hypothetical protein DRN58_08795 [Thermococci archaeon]
MRKLFLVLTFLLVVSGVLAFVRTWVLAEPITKNFKATWSYVCPGREIRFRLYVKTNNSYNLVKEMDGICLTSDTSDKNFEENFSWAVELGTDYTFALVAVNTEGTESDKAECTIHIPLPKPDTPESFSVELTE